MPLDALTDEVLTRCDVLAGCSEETGRITRTFLSPPFRQVHEHLTAWMADAGLGVHIDAVGNVIGLTKATTDRVFLVGSHVDTVPDAGKYDGVLGVLLGIAAAKALRRKHFTLRLDVIAFSEEEGVRFRTPYLGSLAVCGQLTSKHLALRDGEGHTIADAIRNFGLDPAEIPKAAYPAGTVAGYLEAHIEQGPVLESHDLALGVVPAIMGQTRELLTFTGRAGHAGTEPMNLRRDALAAAAVFVSAVERTARATPGLRATVGSLTVSPNAGNVVPGEVRLSLDVRHEDDSIRHTAMIALHTEAKHIAAERGIGFERHPTLDQPAVPCDPGLTSRLAAVMKEQHHRPELVVSGAGHDAAVMATFCPTAMLFIRSPGGISHHPNESVRREDVKAALGVMVKFLEHELME